MDCDIRNIKTDSETRVQQMISEIFEWQEHLEGRV